ncbi:uncharacterized protein PHACADRAFT_266295, partial [Phanerochaete carnosa HHB-10118-sp]
MTTLPRISQGLGVQSRTSTCLMISALSIRHCGRTPLRLLHYREACRSWTSSISAASSPESLLPPSRKLASADASANVSSPENARSASSAPISRTDTHADELPSLVVPSPKLSPALSSEAVPTDTFTRKTLPDDDHSASLKPQHAEMAMRSDTPFDLAMGEGSRTQTHDRQVSLEASDPPTELAPVDEPAQSYQVQDGVSGPPTQIPARSSSLPPSHLRVAEQTAPTTKRGSALLKLSGLKSVRKALRGR